MPAFCRYRVYIIDEVHMLSRQAFDALLKILEEPPPHAVFILATTELQDVPDTIKSRVQIFPFRLIPVAIIEARLNHVCDSEKVSAELGSLRLVAEAGMGSMRDALTILDRVISAGDGKVIETLVREQLGIVPAARVKGVLESLLAGDAVAILDHCDALASMGADWGNFWKELMLSFRNFLENSARSGVPPHETMRLSRMLHLLLQRERDLRDTSLPQVVVELALITAAQLPHLAPLDSLLKIPLKPDGAPQLGYSTPQSSTQLVPPPPPLRTSPPDQRQAQSAASPQGQHKPAPPSQTNRKEAQKPTPTASTPAKQDAPALRSLDEILEAELPLRQLLEDTGAEVIDIRKA
jgi:DNA polymerase-3 subunit gamma/tau